MNNKIITRNMIRKYARIKQMKAFYVEIVNDTNMRIYSQEDVMKMIENNPFTNIDKVLKFKRFKSMYEAKKFVMNSMNSPAVWSCL